jgi:hypothetical protein
MIKTYVPRKKYEIQAVEWQPGMEFPDENFQPQIIVKNGCHYLREAPHEAGLYDCPLEPGYFIIKDIIGYEALTDKGFHEDFVEAVDS